MSVVESKARRRRFELFATSHHLLPVTDKYPTSLRTIVCATTPSYS